LIDDHSNLVANMGVY